MEGLKLNLGSWPRVPPPHGNALLNLQPALLEPSTHPGFAPVPTALLAERTESVLYRCLAM